MKAVWLSSTYYLDEAVQALSPNAERMLTRALAYCGNAETSGYITRGAINMLGLSNPTKLVKELIDGGILIPQPDGRWYFDAWPDWNSSGDKLIARQKADRERQARLRERKKTSRPEHRDDSRENSRDVTPPEERRAEENSGYPRESATDSNGHGGIAATPGAELVDELISRDHPDAVRTMLRIRASELIRQGHPRADVAAAITLWLTKPSLGPNALPSVLSEVLKTRAAPNGGSRPPDKLRVLAELAAEERALEQAQTAAARKELT
jgi:hypothetical protein